jgi:hypothetical protein
MNIAQVENNVKSLIDRLAAGDVSSEDFIYELLLAYGHRASTVSMLRKGHYNIAKDPDEIIFKRHLYFKQMQGNALHAEIDRMKNQKLVATNRTRFVVCTNFDHLLAVDTKTGDSLDIALAELPRKFDFFLPWAGMEKAVYQGENPADVKAAEKMAKLFDLIKADNFNEERAGDKAALHNLNVFLTRLLFCFFAEDTEIFADNQFSNAIQGHTSEDGSDLAEYLNRLFAVLNTPEKERGALPDYLSRFPYVNGGLFADNIPSPGFSRKSRRMLIECGSELNWSDINPDIFGSMIQAVVHPDQRGGMGMHYTSVTNIMKVIEPLFLNDLYEELDKTSNSVTKLQKLQQRLGEIKIFDPACGSGNFLIIAFKELRRLEMELLKRWQELELEETGQILQAFSVIKLSQFFGIELDDFAHEVAILSLWLAEHQMNMEFKLEFGKTIPSLPLTKSGAIFPGNATQASWFDICGVTSSDEIYILGNPPYVSYSDRSKEQKHEMELVFHSMGNVKRLDYIACWFKKGADVLSKAPNGRLAFVSTNSLCQGEQVSLLWPYVFNAGLEIFFAHQTFKWANNAKSNAGVSCVIVGIKPISEKKKQLFDGPIVKTVRQINPYLVEGNTSDVKQLKQPISKLPEMSLGSSGIDGGHLMLSPEDKEEFIATDFRSNKYIKRFFGGGDLLDGTIRYCLWIDDEDLDEAEKIPLIKDRIKKCRSFREGGGRDAKKAAAVPHRFFYRKYKANVESIVIPMTSSERRSYLPVGILSKNVVPSNGIFVIYGFSPLVFGILCSRLHTIWAHAVSGRLESRIRYSVNLTYNNFPIPSINSDQEKRIAEAAVSILSIRENYPSTPLGDLYDPDKMPDDLREVHSRLDSEFEAIYKDSPFKSDSERLGVLFKLHENMTEGQNA